MKLEKVLKLFFCLIVMSTLLFSCTESEEKKDETPETPDSLSITISPVNNTQINVNDSVSWTLSPTDSTLATTHFSFDDNGNTNTGLNYRYNFVNRVTVLNPGILTITLDGQTFRYTVVEPAVTPDPVTITMNPGNNTQIDVDNSISWTLSPAGSSITSTDFSFDDNGNTNTGSNYTYNGSNSVTVLNPGILTITLDGEIFQYTIIEPAPEPVVITMDPVNNTQIDVNSSISWTLSPAGSSITTTDFSFDDNGNTNTGSNYTYNGSNSVTVLNPGILTITLDGEIFQYTVEYPDPVYEVGSIKYEPIVNGEEIENTTLFYYDSNTPYVAYNTEAGIFFKKYNTSDSSWSNIDSQPVTDEVKSFRVLSDATYIYLAYITEAGNIVSVQKYDGANWEMTTASPVSDIDEFDFKMINNKPYLLFSEAENNNNASLYSYNGTTWDSVISLSLQDDTFNKVEGLALTYDKNNPADEERPVVVFINSEKELVFFADIGEVNWPGRIFPTSLTLIDRIEAASIGTKYAISIKHGVGDIAFLTHSVDYSDPSNPTLGSLVQANLTLKTSFSLISDLVNKFYILTTGFDDSFKLYSFDSSGNGTSIDTVTGSAEISPNSLILNSGELHFSGTQVDRNILFFKQELP